MKQILLKTYLKTMSIYDNKTFKILTKSLLVLIVFFIFTCYALRDSFSVRLENTNYEIGWINMPEQTDVYYIALNDRGGVGVGERVTNVYWNDKYILIKKCQHYNYPILA